MAGGRPSKTLLERVVEDSFRPKRYSDLLAGPLLPEEPPRGFRNARQRRAWELLRDGQRHWKDVAAGRWTLPSRSKEENLADVAGYIAEIVRWLHGAPKSSWLD